MQSKFESNKAFKEAGARCLKLDMYGRPVQLTFKGNDKFRTRFGAIITILVGLLIGAFTLFNVLKVSTPGTPY